MKDEFDMWGKLLGGRCMTDSSGKVYPLTLVYVNYMAEHTGYKGGPRK